MSFNPFNEAPEKSEKLFYDWKTIYPESYSKNDTDAFTKTRIILMNGTEYEAVWFSHQFFRHCKDNDLRRQLEFVRKNEQQQQKKIACLKPKDETVLESTIGYEQLAVELTAILAQREPDMNVKAALDFALLEDFDHLYRYADLLDMEHGIHADRLVNGYTEITPARPTIAHHRHPYDDVRKPTNFKKAAPITKLDVAIITAAEQQTMNFYMNVANLYASNLGRKLYNEIAMIEEQHVTGYGCLKDPTATFWEGLLMNEYTECYLYYSCYTDEKDERIKKIWEQHFEEEVAHLHEAAELLRIYEGKVWQQCFPAGGEFPELLKFKSQKNYIREVLKSVRLTGVEEGWEELDKVPDGFRYFGYNAKTNGKPTSVGTHLVIDKAIASFGNDWRLQDKDHPIRALSDRKKDNIEVARVKGK